VNGEQLSKSRPQLARLASSRHERPYRFEHAENALCRLFRREDCPLADGHLTSTRPAFKQGEHVTSRHDSVDGSLESPGLDLGEDLRM
jgi:hypothetical protein